MSTSDDFNDFNDFLKNHEREEDETHITHVSSMFSKSFVIENVTNEDEKFSDIELFWKMYLEQVKGSKVVSIAERTDISKRMSYIPILADIDIKTCFDAKIFEPGKKILSKNVIVKIAKIYQEEIKNLIKLPLALRSAENKKVIPKSDLLFCSVLEKDYPIISDSNAGKKISSGVRFIFPFAWLTKQDQAVHLLPRIKERCVKENVFESVYPFFYPSEEKETMERRIELVNKILDDAIYRNPLLMYGSVKGTEKQQIYKTSVLDVKSNPQYYKFSFGVDSKGKETDITPLLKFKLKDTTGAKIKLTNDNIHYYLPRIFSVFQRPPKHLSLKPKLEYITIKNLKKVSEIKYEKKQGEESIEALLKKSKKLLEIISSERADGYKDWLDIGWILYTTGKGSSEALQLWIEFSKRTGRSDVNPESDCIYQWDKMEPGNKTIGSLFFYAKNDNPSEYEKYVLEEFKTSVKRTLGGCNVDIALYLKMKYGERCVCTDIRNKQWFYFSDTTHRWMLDESGGYLRARMDDLDTEIRKLKKEFKDDAKKIKPYDNISKKLRTTTFRNAVITECAHLFHNTEIEEKFDSDPYLLGFDDCILDIKKQEFREGKPEDYVTKTVGYKYNVPVSKEDEEFLEDFLEKVFPDKELRQYFIEWFADVLQGFNFRKEGNVFNESGNNAKTVVIKLIKTVLGSYTHTLPITILTGRKTQSSSATPEFTEHSKDRLLIAQETSKDDRINSGTWKEMTGGDEMYQRPLYKKGINIRPLFKLCVTCNFLPHLPSDDPASWDRVKLLPFESKFLEKGDPLIPETKEKQYEKKIFERDEKFSEKIDRLKLPLMKKGIKEKFRIDKEGRRPLPKKVISATLKYQMKYDSILQFIIGRIVNIPNVKDLLPVAYKKAIYPDDFTSQELKDVSQSKKDDDLFDLTSVSVSLREFWDELRKWFPDNSPGEKCPNKMSVRDELIRKWGVPLAENRWIGYRLKTDEEVEKLVIVKKEEKGDVRKKNEKVMMD